MRSLLSSGILAVAALVACAACTTGNVIGADPDGGAAGDDGTGTSSGGAGASDGGGATDGGTTKDGGGGDGATTKDDDAIIDLTFVGCSPVFEDVRVVTNVVAYDSLGVSSAFAPLNGGVQVALKNATARSVTLSSTQRSQSGNEVVINVFAGGTTYTNFCHASATGCSYDPASKTWLNDPVSGTFEIKTYAPRDGKLEVVFTNVTLQAVGGLPTCKVNGSLKTKRLSR